MWGNSPVVEKIRRLAVIPYLMTIGLGLSVGCSANETKPAGGGGGTGPASTFATDPCGKCVQTACPNEIADCQSDPDCASYLGCLYACPVDAHGNADANCDAACVPAQSSTESIKKRDEVVGCRFSGPGSDCPTCEIPKGSVSAPLNQDCTGKPPVGTGTACDTCYSKSCCDTWNACFSDDHSECNALATCLGTCTTKPEEPCNEACFNAHPDGVSPLFAQLSCELSKCASEEPNCDATKRDACTTCTFATCGDSFVALLSTEQGFLTFGCEEDCGAADQGPDCIQACIDAHPTAADAAYQWAECITYQCSTTC